MSAAPTTRILLADDHPVVRRGLRLVLDAEPDLAVVAECSDGAEAVDRSLAGDVDLAILDVSMPRLTGIQAARELVRRAPRLRVLMLSMHDNERFCAEAVRAGASGYVVKSVADRELVAACRAAIRGEQFAGPGAAAAAGEEPRLSPREQEVVKLVAEGHTSREIAELLVITEKTVERHRGNALDKLSMRDRVDLTRWAIRTGLVEA